MKSFAFFFLLCIPCREISIADWAIWDEETRNESTAAAESWKTWFLGNDCRSCFFDVEEYWRDVDRRWRLEFDESLLKYTENIIYWKRIKQKKITV